MFLAWGWQLPVHSLPPPRFSGGGGGPLWDDSISAINATGLESLKGFRLHSNNFVIPFRPACSPWCPRPHTAKIGNSSVPDAQADKKSLDLGSPDLALMGLSSPPPPRTQGEPHLALLPVGPVLPPSLTTALKVLDSWKNHDTFLHRKTGGKKVTTFVGYSFILARFKPQTVLRQGETRAKVRTGTPLGSPQCCIQEGCGTGRSLKPHGAVK